MSKKDIASPVFCLQGGGVTSQNSQGCGWNMEVCFTLNAIDVHGVVYALATQQGGAEITDNGICPTLTAAAGMSGNNQPCVVLEMKHELPKDNRSSDGK